MDLSRNMNICRRAELPFTTMCRFLICCFAASQVRSGGQERHGKDDAAACAERAPDPGHAAGAPDPTCRAGGEGN